MGARMRIGSSRNEVAGDVNERSDTQVGNAHLLVDSKRVLEDGLERRLPINVLGICSARDAHQRRWSDRDRRQV
jgi:hypothetical protein